MIAPAQRARIAAAAALLLVAVVGLLLWQHGRPPLPRSQLEGFLDRSLGAGRVRFTVVSQSTVRQDEAGLEISVEARARAIQTLYTRIDSADYLQHLTGADPAETAPARELLAQATLRTDPVYRSAAPFPADPYLWTVLRETAAAGSEFDFECLVEARREAGAWRLSVESSAFNRGAPRGDPRSTFGDSTFVAGDAADDARLHSGVSDLRAFAARAGEARRLAEETTAAQVDARRKAFLARLAPGTLFEGSAVEAGTQHSVPLYLEITAVSPTREVSALLRNDGGWREARAFSGSWASDEAFASPTLTLVSLPRQAVRGAGAFLETTQAWTFPLAFEAPGALSSSDRRYQVSFRALSAGAAAALRERLDAEFRGAWGATEPGRLYLGSVAYGTPVQRQAVLLRILRRSEGGDEVEAVAESPDHPWKRPFHGSILANARRSAGAPLRLSSPAADAVEDAPAASLLGSRDAIELSLAVSDGAISGGDDAFSCSLAPASQADLDRLRAEGQARARALRAVCRPGIEFDGKLREEQGFVARVRLSILSVDEASHTVRVVFSPIANPSVRREFEGTLDPATGSLDLHTNGHGSLDTSEGFNAPFFKSLADATIHLSVSGPLLSGRIEGNDQWTIEFSASAFLSATTESAEPDAPKADGAVFPSFPKAPGAYLLQHGAWTRLPDNLGHVALETADDGSELRLPTNLMAIVATGVDVLSRAKAKQKVSYVEFSGKDTPVKSDSTAWTLLMVGASSQAAQVEISPADVMRDGRVRVEVRGASTKAARLVGPRVSVFGRRPADGYLLVTTTSDLAAGPYVLLAGDAYQVTQE